MTPSTGLTWEEWNGALRARFHSSHKHNTNGVTSKELAACPGYSGTETCLACTITCTSGKAGVCFSKP